MLGEQLGQIIGRPEARVEQQLVQASASHPMETKLGEVETENCYQQAERYYRVMKERTG
jgi:hypothetical protein